MLVAVKHATTVWSGGFGEKIYAWCVCCWGQGLPPAALGSIHGQGAQPPAAAITLRDFAGDCPSPAPLSTVSGGIPIFACCALFLLVLDFDYL